MNVHRWIRFEVTGMTLAELEQNARAELTRLTGDPVLAFNLDISGGLIDVSTPADPHATIPGPYRAEVKAVVERAA